MTASVTSENLEPVASELRYAGHTLTQVFREKRIAIYARAMPDREPHELELVAIRQRPEATLPNGAIVPEREAYPSNSEWGRYAWSFPIREREFVFGLAARMAAMDGPYGAWVREQITLHKQNFPTRADRRSQTRKRIYRSTDFCFSVRL
jgi:hypothetical protein